MKKINKLLTIVSLILVSACVQTNTSAGNGLFLTNTKEGLMQNNNVVSEKTGKSCGHNILGLTSFGDSTIEAAKIDGRIKNISTINRNYFSILGVYGKSCLIVKGN
jgi:hypothetical protein